MAAPTIVAGLRQLLAAHLPFSRMAGADLDFLLTHVEVAYFAPGETVLAPAGETPSHCLIVKQGRVRGMLDAKAEDSVVFEAAIGDCFPVGAMLADRPVTLTYVAVGDTFCLLLPREHFETLTRRSEPFLDYCKRRLGALLDQSRQQLQATFAAAASSERNMNTPLADLLHGAPITCAPDDTLRVAFERMDAVKVGSVVVVEGSSEDNPGKGDVVAGILTLTDLLGRVILPGVDLDTPIARVMTRDVLTLDDSDTAADATVLMAEHGIRHLPVMHEDNGIRRLAGVVSERNLFALQRLSVRSLANAVQRADDVDSVAAIAADVRRLSYHLVAQGVGAAQLTRLISHLNDRVTSRVLELACARFNLDANSFCWLALGSEGRGEQTIATDQDNGIVFDPARAGREQLLELAAWSNDALAAAGFPLCKGGVMARNPRWCLSQSDWRELFSQWIDRGDPESLLEASIFFDFRGLFGDLQQAVIVRGRVVHEASRNVRFLKQMADNALRTRAGSRGLIETLFGESVGETLADTFGDGGGNVDLKMNGTVPLVDAARIWALGAQITETNTAERFRRLAARGRIPEHDVAGWIDAFEFLQLARLRAQYAASASGSSTNPNQIALTDLSPLDRRILKESFRQARKAQQRLMLDFPG